MRVVIPFAADGLAVEVRELGQRFNAEFVDLTGKEHGYFNLVRRLWAQGESFVLLEQDVLPEPGFLAGLWACERDWCGGAFPQLMALKTRDGNPVGRLKLVLNFGMGCTKFGGALLRREADAMERATAISTRHWSVLDKVLLHEVLMKERGHPGPHIHLGEVRHLRVESSHFPLEPRLDYHHRHWRRRFSPGNGARRLWAAITSSP